jgi:hypothetical protein
MSRDRYYLNEKEKNPYAKALKRFTQKIVPDKTKYDRKKIKKENI